MALGDLDPNVEMNSGSSNKQKGKQHQTHPSEDTDHPLHSTFRRNGWDDDIDKYWSWFHELEERFPEPIQCAFIEVSDKMTRCNAKAYWRKRDGEEIMFIRIAEHYQSMGEDTLKQLILHEMVHLYMLQKGYKDVGDGSHMFKWVCGQVGTRINQVNTSSTKWEELGKPFLETDDSE